jgi:hypothetical protein
MVTGFTIGCTGIVVVVSAAALLSHLDLLHTNFALMYQFLKFFVLISRLLRLEGRGSAFFCILADITGVQVVVLGFEVLLLLLLHLFSIRKRTKLCYLVSRYRKYNGMSKVNEFSDSCNVVLDKTPNTL